MQISFDNQMSEFHRGLPGVLRAVLLDLGLSEHVIRQRRLGWDGRAVTVPIVDAHGVAYFVERWHIASDDAVRVESAPRVELFGQDTLASLGGARFAESDVRTGGADGGSAGFVVFAEGVLEALVLESCGAAAVAATGSGRYFKGREWGTLLRQAPDVAVALRRGERRAERKGQLSRSEVESRILEALPDARHATWPPAAGRGGGARSLLARKHRPCAYVMAVLQGEGPGDARPDQL